MYFSSSTHGTSCGQRVAYFENEKESDEMCKQNYVAACCQPDLVMPRPAGTVAICVVSLCRHENPDEIILPQLHVGCGGTQPFILL